MHIFTFHSLIETAYFVVTLISSILLPHRVKKPLETQIMNLLPRGKGCTSQERKLEQLHTGGGGSGAAERRWLLRLFLHETL